MYTLLPHPNASVPAITDQFSRLQLVGISPDACYVLELAFGRGNMVYDRSRTSTTAPVSLCMDALYDMRCSHVCFEPCHTPNVSAPVSPLT